MHAVADTMEGWGMRVGQRSGPGQVDKYVGYVPRLSPARWELPDAKVIHLYEALTWLISYPIVKISFIDSVLGVWLWCALLQRDLLCIPASIFDMIRKNRGRSIHWWPSARAEARRMRDVLVLTYADVGAPLLRVLFSTDAMGADEEGVDHGGYGICVRPASRQLMEHVFQYGGRMGKTVVSLDGKHRALKYPEKPLDATKPYSLLDPEVTKQDAWSDVLGGRWAFPDAIMLGEGRAVIRMLDVLLLWEPAFRAKILSLQDNQSVSGAFLKGRSPAPSMNYLCRKKTARTLAAAWRLLLPWVETTRQVADYLSRLVP
jgi:hypothetical protein